MATTIPTKTSEGNNVVIYTWSLTKAGGTLDVGAPIRMHDYADRSVQVLGTFGASGSVLWEGSNDGGTTYATLTDPGNTALNFTTASIETVLDFTLLQRPRLAVGETDVSSLTVILVCRRIRDLKGG